mgnify:CR=1 FL=1
MTSGCDEPGCTKPHRARGKCATHYNQRYAPDRHRRTTVCVHCGTTYATTRSRGRFCSTRCYVENTWGFVGWRAPARRSRPWFTRIALPLPTAATARTIVCGQCLACGAWFATLGPRRQSCSPECSSRIKRAKIRRAHARRKLLDRSGIIEDFDPIEIYQRDRWVCAICKRKIRRYLTAPHPLSPTLDHIVPRSQRGDHTRANVRAAHMICNSMRGNRGGGEQLALLG